MLIKLQEKKGIPQYKKYKKNDYCRGEHPQLQSCRV